MSECKNLSDPGSMPEKLERYPILCEARITRERRHPAAYYLPLRGKNSSQWNSCTSIYGAPTQRALQPPLPITFYAGKTILIYHCLSAHSVFAGQAPSSTPKIQTLLFRNRQRLATCHCGLLALVVTLITYL